MIPLPGNLISGKDNFPINHLSNVVALSPCRPSVKDLLNHEFFAEDTGLKVEVVSRDEALTSNLPRFDFRLRVLDPKKRRDKHKDNEAIQFVFDVDTDDADEIAQGMVSRSLFSKPFT